MKKILFYIIIISMLVAMVSCNRSEIQNSDRIKLNDLYAYIPYNENGIIVEYKKNDIEIKAIVKDKITKRTIAIFGEYLADLKDLPENILWQLPESFQIRAQELQKSQNKPVSSDKEGKIFNKVVYSDYILGTEVAARLYCGIEYYKDKDEQVITEIIGHYWKSENDNYTLKHARSGASIWIDSASLGVYGGCNLEKEITIKTNDNSQYTRGVHKTIKKLKDLGFYLDKKSSDRTTETYFIRYTIDEFNYFYSINTNKSSLNSKNIDIKK